MSGEMMQFPNNMKQFLDKYSFLDRERIYTNGSLLIPTFRVKQALDHYVPKWNLINNGLPEDETDEKWTPIQFWIIDELSKFIKTCADNNEPLDLYTGMASGCDIAFAIAGVSMHYINSIKLHCILPCKNYNSSHKYYKFLKLKATEWVELSDKFYKGCDNVRDQYIVDKCDVLLAIWDGNKSGGV